MRVLAEFVSNSAQSTCGLAAALKAVGNSAVDFLTSAIGGRISVFAHSATQRLDDLAPVTVGNCGTVAGHTVSICIEGVIPDASCAELGSAELAVLETLRSTDGSTGEELIATGEGQQQADKKELGHHFLNIIPVF